MFYFVIASRRRSNLNFQGLLRSLCSLAMTFYCTLMTYDETIKFLYSLEKFGIKLGLESISNLLVLLNDPHQKFKSIHITGTNGKGSTAAMIASILQCAGYKTALYTSPHLQDFRERIRINGVMIPEEDVIELTELIRNRIYNHSELSLTFFEMPQRL